MQDSPNPELLGPELPDERPPGPAGNHTSIQKRRTDPQSTKPEPEAPPERFKQKQTYPKKIMRVTSHPSTDDEADEFLSPYLIVDGICTPISQEQFEINLEFAGVRKVFNDYDPELQQQWIDIPKDPSPTSLKDAVACGWSSEHPRIQYKSVRYFRMMLHRRGYPHTVITREACRQILEAEYQDQLRQNARRRRTKRQNHSPIKQ